jgi:hypothetical protein
MAHELETMTNGQTAFVSARLSAWHQLGTVADDCMTAEEVMAKAFLGGWMVRKIHLQGVETTPDGVTIIECPDKRMTVPPTSSPAPPNIWASSAPSLTIDDLQSSPTGSVHPVCGW